MPKPRPPVACAKGIWWLGSSDPRDFLQANSYLLVTGERGIVFDPGPVPSFAETVSALEECIPLDKISYIVLSHQDPDVCASLPLWEERGFRGQLVAHWRTALLLPSYGLRSRIRSIYRRENLIETGGYLTARGKGGRDTVGEDLEVVIRLARSLRERRIPFVIDYAHNANCWTEVPEDLSSLLKQRDRWHRGLMENMVFHRTLLANPRYGVIGLLAFPYFHLFELLGPFVEASGWLLLALSLASGLVSPLTVLGLFLLVCGMGLLVSLTALFLAERGVVYFQGREFRAILFWCLVENFGYRQLLSFQRPASYLRFLFTASTWQKLARKGFSRTGS